MLLSARPPCSSKTLRLSVATAIAALTVTIGLTACGADDDNAAAETTATTTSAPATSTSAAGQAAAGAPDVATLTAVLDSLADPAKPTAAKTELIVDGEKRTANIDQMNQALSGYGRLTFAVSDITTQGDTATAQVIITSPHGAAPVLPLTWEHVDGAWKLSDASGCLMLGFAQAPCVPA